MKRVRSDQFPKETKRTIILEDMQVEISLGINDETKKKEIIYFHVREEDLGDAIYEYLMREKLKKNGKFPALFAAKDCDSYEPIIPGHPKYMSCQYCRGLEACSKYVSKAEGNKLKIVTP